MSQTTVSRFHLGSLELNVVGVLVLVAHLTLVLNSVRHSSKVDGVLTGAHSPALLVLVGRHRCVNDQLLSLLRHGLVKLQGHRGLKLGLEALVELCL